MWTVWNIGPVTIQLAAVGLALILSVPLSVAAYRLPRSLDGAISPVPSVAHRRWRMGVLIAGVILAMLCALRFGPTPAAVAAIVYVNVLLTLAWIDAETGFLPDMMTISLLWLGLLVNVNDTFALLGHAVVGAAAGYMLLWSISGLFLLLAGRQGMGHGDFKLLAALGAWVGWMSLPWVLIISSSLALAMAFMQRLRGRLDAKASFSFGPYLAIAGIVVLLRL
ncbi:prepilin peptidase [Allopusillimonas ginsengisoli]|uniref:prepilin peptidase n=1 Tax=Allopusillimonas ginsengisoli TaxID=453575 RepID=UPI001485192B